MHLRAVHQRPRLEAEVHLRLRVAPFPLLRRFSPQALDHQIAQPAADGADGLVHDVGAGFLQDLLRLLVEPADPAGGVDGDDAGRHGMQKRLRQRLLHPGFFVEQAVLEDNRNVLGQADQFLEVGFRERQPGHAPAEEDPPGNPPSGVQRDDRLGPERIQHLLEEGGFGRIVKMHQHGGGNQVRVQPQPAQQRIVVGELESGRFPRAVSGRL